MLTKHFLHVPTAIEYSIAGQVTEQSPGPGKQLLLVQPNACAESKKRRRQNDAVRQCCQEQPKLLYGLAASLGPGGCLSPGLSRLYSDKTLQYWFPFLCACSLQHAHLRESAWRYAWNSSQQGSWLTWLTVLKLKLRLHGCHSCSRYRWGPTRGWGLCKSHNIST